jgi:PKHD-type hydroxylase
MAVRGATEATVHDRGPYSTHEVHLDVFDPDECDRIIAMGSSLHLDRAGVEGDEGALADGGIRRAAIAWLSRDADTEWIHLRLASVCAEANERYGFDLSGVDEDLQFTTYDEPGAFYTWHQDGLDGPVAHRKLSMVVQLSDPETYEGADLELFQVVADLDEDELAEFRQLTSSRGAVVVFPAFEYHRVTPLRRGTRCSLVSWVSGPPFR